MTREALTRDWIQYSEYVLRALDEGKASYEAINCQLDDVNLTVAELRSDLRLLKFKVALVVGAGGAVIGAIVGALTSIGTAVALHYLK